MSNKYRGTCGSCFKPVEPRQGVMVAGRVYHLACRRQEAQKPPPAIGPRRKVYTPPRVEPFKRRRP